MVLAACQQIQWLEVTPKHFKDLKMWKWWKKQLRGMYFRMLNDGKQGGQCFVAKYTPTNSTSTQTLKTKVHWKLFQN